MKDITLGRYYPGDSIVHRMDARFKFFISIAMMIGIFFLTGALPFAVYAIFLMVLIILTRIPLKQIFLSLKPILFIIVFAFVINLFSYQGTELWSLGRLTITYEGLYSGLRMAARLSLLIITSSVFLTLTTTPLNVADAMESIMKPLQKIGFPAHEISMMMSIALRFVPNLMEETDKIMKAQSSRGAKYDTGGVVARARGLVSILVPLFVSCFRRAEELAIAMEARCYNGAQGRTKLNVMKAVRPDYIMTGVCLLVLAVVLFLEFVRF
ncbi:MAG: energy-coupling factor transporter transmembrane component T [Eubacteriales bacterium]|nr:energy-coupling factor transporter transmembrane component T [Eubacteriales bacterium]MDD4326680.1 energy-coupling factor transporter transmembrane component T [Eubacteriales bacterium]MDD4716978.1 energy-coupling factor transporter transmembrane component T [Eubacteriales bacterium]NCU25234.1 energy-coupling factor transporter transmembrane protein EcfT [Candidatus Nomurabacteria bacterium]